MVSFALLEIIYNAAKLEHEDLPWDQDHRLALLAVYDKGWEDGEERGYRRAANAIQNVNTAD